MLRKEGSYIRAKHIRQNRNSSKNMRFGFSCCYMRVSKTIRGKLLQNVPPLCCHDTLSAVLTANATLLLFKDRLFEPSDCMISTQLVVDQCRPVEIPHKLTNYNILKRHSLGLLGVYGQNKIYI